MKKRKGIGRDIPLQWVLIVPFVFQILLAVGLTGWLSWQSGQTAVQMLVNELQNNISDRIQIRTQNFLSTPIQVNQINAREIQSTHLDLNNSEQIIRHFITLQQIFPQINHISIGKEDGTYIAVRQSKTKGFLDLLLVNPQEPKSIYNYLADEQGKRILLKRIGRNYDPRDRPWYKEAVQAGKPGWSDIYNYFDATTTGISHLYPLYAQQIVTPSQANPPANPQGPTPKLPLIGVLATDFDLVDISSFLQSIVIGKTGQAFILERNYNLVASSHPENLFTIDRGKTLRVRADQSKNSLIREAALNLRTIFPELEAVKKKEELILTTGGKKFVQIRPLIQEEGLDWLLVVVIPKADFTKEIDRNAYITLGICLIIFLLSSLLSFTIYRQLSDWILRFSHAAQAISFGQLASPDPEPVPRIRELAILARAIDQMRQQLHDSFTTLETTNRDLEERVMWRTAELQEANQNLQYLATIDALTGAANRRHFNDYLEQQWRQALRYKHPLTLIICDVDCFKIYNDTYGHQAGDKCLQQVVAAICGVVKRPQDLVARYGGEEFAVILPDTHLEGARSMAMEIIKAVADLKIPNARSTVAPHVTISLGFCCVVPTLELSIDQLITTADQALYAAKEQGRNGYQEALTKLS
ncbi:MAG: diguanylate cyclase [Coleofasciculaceae cyanobacterium SM2_1_6]|nr:diguanylate cyclase [Coleofasciculaceae cyanobacterium SM2_1_6]